MSLKSVILIPAYHPDEKLLTLLLQLREYKYNNIIVVNDGSGREYDAIFDKVKEFPEVTLLDHAINMGKGAALKTGFNYICSNCPETSCVLTADSDGQHTPADIKRLSDDYDARPGNLILGTRSFDKDVPFRSLFGNRLTAFLMRLLLNIKVSDTQTGLRAIPVKFLPHLLQIPFNRYEFELEMLLLAKRMSLPIVEMPISTVYINGNESSHFNPLRDSFKIYIVLFRYAIVSILASTVDYLVFLPCILLLPELNGIKPETNEILSVSAGRIAGAILQYCMIRKIVFRTKKSVLTTLPLYFLLVAASGTASYIIMNNLNRPTGWPDALTKLVAEAALFLANFLILREFIFHAPSNTEDFSS